MVSQELPNLLNPLIILAKLNKYDLQIFSSQQIYNCSHFSHGSNHLNHNQ